MGLTVFFLLLFCAFFNSCGGGGSTVSPSMEDVTSQTSDSSENYVRLLWGIWEISLDPSTNSTLAVPVRGAAFNANVTKFLQPPSAPINLLSVSINPGTSWPTGHADLNISIRHPFPGIPSFRGFDVRGILMGDGTWHTSFDASAIMSGPDEIKLENCDGWTRWWNPTEFLSYEKILGYTQGSYASSLHATSVVNPYKYFADGLDPDSLISDLDPASRGSFGVNPGINTRRYVIQFPISSTGNPIFKFNYAIDASWTPPIDDSDPNFPVGAYPPEANMPEAWRVEIDSSESSAWYVNDSAKGGMVRLNIEVFDWQGAGQPSGVAGEVSAIMSDCELFPLINDLYPMSIVLPGSGASSVFQVDITDPVLTSAGTYDLWIGVQADNPSNYAPQIAGGPGSWIYPDVPIRSYWHSTIEISPFFPQAAPTVLEINPSQGTQSTVVIDLQIIGENFQDGASVEFSQDGTPLVVSNINWVDSMLITCDVDCAGNAGFYDVRVVNPDTQEDTLDDGFEITAKQDSIWWTSHMYNARNIGMNPTVPGADPDTLTVSWSSPVPGDKKYCTPVVADGKIYFTGNNGFYGNTSMTIYCFDLYTGELKWSHPINPSGITAYRAFACPVWWDGGSKKYLAVGGDQIYCYNADTGDEEWTFDASYDTVDVNWISNQLQEYEGKILARSRFPRLYVLDFITGAMLQEIICTQSAEGGCAADNGRVYINSGHYVECADISSGIMDWSTLLPYDAGMSHWINPTIANGRVYVSTYEGYVFALAQVAQGSYMPGDVIWSWQDPLKPSGSNPLVGGTAVSGDKVFVAAAFSGNYVYCLDALSDIGTMLWKSETTGYFDASPVWSTAPSFPEGVVYCPDRDGYLLAYDASDGHQVWSLSTGGELRAGMTPILNMLVVTTGTDVTVYEGP